MGLRAGGCAFLRGGKKRRADDGGGKETDRIKDTAYC
jgi:hypothetical protein